MFLKKIQAIHENDSRKFSKKIEHLTRDEQQKELEKFVSDEDLSEQDVSELLYDLSKEHINLKKPVKTSKAKRNLPTPETLAKKFSKDLWVRCQ